MGINKVLVSTDRSMVNTVRTLKRDVRGLKTPQKVGGDIVQVQSLPSASAVNISGPWTLPSNSSVFIAQPYSPDNKVLTLWNFEVSLYIDATLDPITGIPDAANRYPSGGSLSSTTIQKMRFESWLDWATSVDSTNTKSFMVFVNNIDTVSHTYFIVQKAYLPNLNQS